MDSFAGWPGRAHDAVTYKASSVCKELYYRTDGFKYMLLGDKAYPLSEGLMTPYVGRVENLSPVQRNFNKVVSSVRQVRLYYSSIYQCEFPQ